MKQKLWEILVPCTKNDGTHVKTRHHRRWDDAVKKIANGLTIMKTSTGIWTSPAGDEYREKMIPVRVMCTEDQIREIARVTLKHYYQLAVMFHCVSEHAEIVDLGDFDPVVGDTWSVEGVRAGDHEHQDRRRRSRSAGLRVPRVERHRLGRDRRATLSPTRQDRGHRRGSR